MISLGTLVLTTSVLLSGHWIIYFPYPLHSGHWTDLSHVIWLSVRIYV